MPIFEYVAINSAGRQQKGQVDAENIRAARQRLRNQGVFPTDIHEAAAGGKRRTIDFKDIGKFFQSDRVPMADLAVATRQLATLSAAGLPLVSALLALCDQTESQNLRRIFTDVREKVEEGLSLAKAMGNFPKAFPRLYINMIASGETSGQLDAVLENLADYLEAQLELKRKVTSAMMYPAIMLCICVLVIIALVAFVVPKIVEIFQKQGAVLPLPTRVLITISNATLTWWPLLLALVFGTTWFIGWYYRQPSGRNKIDRWLLNAPLVGRLYVKVCCARIGRTLGALLASGVGLLQALQITRNIINNTHVCKSLDDAQDGVREGRSLARELQKAGIFPPPSLAYDCCWRKKRAA